MTTFLADLLRAAGRPLPRRAERISRRTVQPVDSPAVVRPLAEAQQEVVSLPPQSAPAEVSVSFVSEKPGLPAAPHESVASGAGHFGQSRQSQPRLAQEIEARQQRELFQEREQERVIAANPFPKGSSQSTHFRIDSAAVPPRGEMQSPKPVVQKTNQNRPKLPAPRMASTDVPASDATEARLTDRSSFLLPSPLRPGKVPYIEFAAKGNVVSSLGSLPAATSAVTHPNPEISAPSMPRFLESREGKSPPDTLLSTRISAPPMISENHGEEPADKSVAPTPIILSPVTVGTLPKLSPTGPENNQKSDRQAPREIPHVRQPMRGPDNSINIKHIDIQILNDTPRTTMAAQHAPTRGDDSIFACLDRHYIREII